MAARLNNRHQEMVRKKIQTSHIIGVLHDCIDGKIELTKAQVQSASILLSKSLSNAPEFRELNVSGDLNLAWPVPRSSLDQP
jgi:hypothetical protein